MSQIFFSGLGCGGYAFMFGGTFIDSFFGFFIGMLLQVFCDCLKRHNTSRFVVNIFGSAMVTAGALLVLYLGFPVLYDKDHHRMHPAFSARYRPDDLHS